MTEYFKGITEKFIDYDFELLLKIINRTLVETKKRDDKELFVDENWKMISLSSKDIPQNKSSVLVSALEHTVRSEKNMARDKFRHPYETLTFFGISPSMKVVELSPGGGWYTEIFASYLEQGNLIAAHHDPNSKSNYQKRSRALLLF